jgi:phosphoglycerol transferase MdoB-like AlkP superfamily enzyme
MRAVQRFKLAAIMYFALATFGVLLFFSGPQWYLAALVTLPAIAILGFVFWLRGPKMGRKHVRQQHRVTA